MFSIKDIYEARPFKTRNADEYTNLELLELFVDPTAGVSGPFDYSNEIVKGKMGSGKTMYLRANYYYYASTLVPSMMENCDIILPVYIKLSDFQNELNPQKVYSHIIIKIIEEILRTSDRLQSAEELVRLHSGLKECVHNSWNIGFSQKEIIEKLNKMTSEEYIQTVSSELSINGSIGNNFITAESRYQKNALIELHRKETPAISDIDYAYNQILGPIGAKLLLLLDEVGSLNKAFFMEESGNSYFEILMNQLRTLDYLRTKIAIYPNSYCDILTETRYGDVRELNDDVIGDGYEIFLNKAITLCDKYIQLVCPDTFTAKAEDIMNIGPENMKLMEQIIYGSDGNMRRLVHILDTTFDKAYSRTQGNGKVEISDVLLALKSHAASMKSLYHGSDQEFLLDLADVCKNRSTYKFRFPNKSPSLLKYTNRSSEYNVLNIIESGAGRRGTTYGFDYTFCVLQDIPTHYVFNSEKIARSRSISEGNWIKRIAQLNDQILEQASIPGKVEGQLFYVNDKRESGFIKYGENQEAFITQDFLIESDRHKRLTSGQKIRFIPIVYGDSIYAREAELL